MGAAASYQSNIAGGDENADPRGAFLVAMQSFTTGGSESDISNASGVFYGGKSEKEDALEDLKKYHASKSAQVKEKVVKAIAQALKGLGISSSSDNIHELIKHIPDPAKDTFPDDAEVHAEICKEIAKHINGALGHVIDERDPPEVICKRVHDLVDSFSHGVQWEFLHVYKNINEALQEMQVVFGVMQSAYRNFLHHLKDVDADVDAEKFKQMYEKAEREFELRIQVLNGLLHTDVLLAKEELDLALKYQKADNAILKKLGMVPGTSHFSDQIAYAISKTGTMAAVTDTVHKALKKVGMDVDEFMSLKNMSALDDKIEEMHENLLRKNKGKKNRKALEEFQEAIEKLKKWFIKMKSDNKFAMGSAEGGVESGAQKFKRRYATEDRADKLLKQMALRHRSKLLFIKGFAKGLYQRYDGVLRAVNALGPRVGREIPTGPKMEDLMDAFRRLAIRNLRSNDMDLALLGIENNVVGREIKESFLSSLKLIVRKVDDVLSSKDYGGSSSYFNALKGAIDEIVKYIDRYNELRKLKFGGAVDVPKDMEPLIGEDVDSLIQSGKTDVYEKTKATYMEKRRQMAEDTNKALDRADAEYYDLEDKYNELKAREDEANHQEAEKVVKDAENEAEAAKTESEGVAYLALRKGLENSTYQLERQRLARESGKDISEIPDLSQLKSVYRGEYEESDDEEDGFPRSAYGGAIEREWDTKDAYNRYKQGLDGYTPKDAYKLEEAVGKMMYFYYIAGVRENLKMASTELSHYGKNYDEVLNSAMAVRKAEIARERDRRLEQLELDYEFYFKPKIDFGGGNKVSLWEDLMTADEYESFKDIINAEYDAKINLYKAIEAIELYLKDYTRVIASNPDIIKDLKKVLESNNNIFNWFNNETGDALGNAFDSPTYDQGALPHMRGVSLGEHIRRFKKLMSEIDEVKNSDNHYYVRFLHNGLNGWITQAGLQGGEAAVIAQELTNDITVAGNQQNPDMVRDSRLPVNASRDNKKNFEAIERAHDYVEYAVNSFQALQNIMNSFIMIANVANSGDVKKVMAPRQIYKLLVNYILASTFVLGVSQAADAAATAPCDASYAPGRTVLTAQIPRLAGAPVPLALAPYPDALGYKDPTTGKRVVLNAGGAVVTLDTLSAVNIDGDSLKKRESDAKDDEKWEDDPGVAAGAPGALTARQKYVKDLKKRWASYRLFFASASSQSRYSHLGTNFQRDNIFFSYALKAIVGKILVTIGVYDFINRDEAPLDKIHNPEVRFILGGDDDDKPPEVRPQLAELYYRVPRLMETYRRALNPTTQDWQVTMLVDPEMRFVDFFEFMFEELEYETVIEGGYSTQECWKLIKFINELHDEIKGDPRNVIHELYKEVNRRYNIIKKEELERSKKLKQWRHRADYTDRPTFYSRNQIDILPDDELGDIAMVPSDHYMLPEDPARKTKVELDKKLLYKIDENPDGGLGPWDDGQGGLNHYLIIRDFRDKISSYFQGINFERYTRNIYKNVIDQYRTEMQNAKSDAEKVSVAVRLISTDSRMTSIDSRKLMVFHETVVYGLNVLNGLHKSIKDFMDFCADISFDKFRKAVRENLLTSRYDKTSIDWGRMGTEAARNFNVARPAGAAFPRPAAGCQGLTGVLRRYAMDASESYNGRAGLNPKATLGEVMELLVNNMPAGTPDEVDAFAEQLWRLCFRNEDIMRDVLLNLFNFGFDLQGLVKVEFSHTDNRVTVFATELRDLIMNLLSDVRQFLEIFRAHLPDTVIAEYEHGTQRPGTLTIDGAPQAGTLYFLEQEFVDRIFRRSEEDFEYISPDQTFFKGQPTFNQHIRLLNGTLLQLTKKYDVAKIKTLPAFWNAAAAPSAHRTFLPLGYHNPHVARAVAVLPAGVGPEPIIQVARLTQAQATLRDARIQRDEYGNAIAEILFYNALKVDSGVSSGKLKPIDTTEWGRFMDASLGMLDDPEWIQLASLNPPPGPAPPAATRNSDILGLGFHNQLPFLLWKRVVMDIKTSQPSDPALKKFVRRAGGRSLPSAGAAAAAANPADVDTKIIEPNSRFSERFPLTTCTHQMYHASGLENHSSLMYLFNQYLVWFLNALYDRTNYKIYAQLMKSFISGPLSSVIANVDVANNAKVYPDLIEFLQSSDLDNFCQRMDPASGVILLQSVAQMLKTLIQTKGPEGHAFLIQNSADLPGYSKENMKLNLPIFIKLFDYVTKFSTFVKDAILGMDMVVSRHSLQTMLENAYRPATAAGPAGPSLRAELGVGAANFRIFNTDPAVRAFVNVLGGPRAYKPTSTGLSPIAAAGYRLISINWDGIKSWDQMRATLTNDAARDTFTTFLNNITSASEAVQKSCREVMRELVDEHVYMEISDGFISNYKGKTSGKLPIMPLSSSLHQLRPAIGDVDRMLPTSAISDPRFRYMYSQRHLYLYNDKPEGSKYPYVAPMLGEFNTLVPESDKISDSRYMAFASKAIDASRFLANLGFFKGAYGVLANINSSQLWSGMTPRNNVTNPKLLVSQLKPIVTDETVLEITESMDHRRKLDELTTAILSKQSPDFANSRADEQRFNMIDMNLVPFNPSGFMREVPLTNIYNYCYTFEDMACSMFGITNKSSVRAPFPAGTDPLMPNFPGGPLPAGGPQQPSVKDTFVNLLLRPYADVDKELVYGVGVRGRPPHGGPSIDLVAPLQRIFRGDNALNLGTPKFLSDQIFNKVLFQSVYPRSMQAFNEEGGPIYSLGRLLNPGDRSTRLNAANDPFDEVVGDSVLMTRDRSTGRLIHNFTLTFPYRQKKVFGIKTVNVTRLSMEELMDYGYDRFNTNIVRNMFFITNLYRTLRLKLNQELVQTRSMIVSTDNLVTPAITEYGVSKTGHTEIFNDNEIDSAYPSYAVARRNLYM